MASVADTSRMEPSMTLTIECKSHGRANVAVVCCHMIASREAVGFVENSSDPDDLQAWCDACEEMFLQEGDKTDAFCAFNDMAVVCINCYASLKDRHSP